MKKSQTPNSKFQTRRCPRPVLELGFWDLFGIWDLGFGVSSLEASPFSSAPFPSSTSPATSAPLTSTPTYGGLISVFCPQPSPACFCWSPHFVSSLLPSAPHAPPGAGSSPRAVQPLCLPSSSPMPCSSTASSPTDRKSTRLNSSHLP